MSDATVYLVGIGANCVFSFGAMSHLRRPLRLALIDLSGTADRASFWCAFSDVISFLFPLLFMLSYRPFWPTPSDSWLWVFSETFMLGLLGLIFPLVFLGILMGCFSSRGEIPAIAQKQSDMSRSS